MCVFNLYIFKDGGKKDRLFRKSHKLGLIQLLSGGFNKMPGGFMGPKHDNFVFVLASESASLQF